MREIQGDLTALASEKLVLQAGLRSLPRPPYRNAPITLRTRRAAAPEAYTHSGDPVGGLLLDDVDWLRMVACRRLFPMARAGRLLAERRALARRGDRGAGFGVESTRVP
jgi:hypothetical protein